MTLTCNACIHKDVCNNLIASGLPYADEQFPASKFCLYFKNKADFQEIKSCLTCSKVHFKQDEFWDNDDVCICGADNHYIGYPDEAEKECCDNWERQEVLLYGRLLQAKNE